MLNRRGFVGVGDLIFAAALFLGEGDLVFGAALTLGGDGFVTGATLASCGDKVFVGGLGPACVGDFCVVCCFADDRVDRRGANAMGALKSLGLSSDSTLNTEELKHRNSSEIYFLYVYIPLNYSSKLG